MMLLPLLLVLDCWLLTPAELLCGRRGSVKRSTKLAALGFHAGLLQASNFSLCFFPVHFIFRSMLYFLSQMSRRPIRFVLLGSTHNHYIQTWLCVLPHIRLCEVVLHLNMSFFRCMSIASYPTL